MRRPSFQFYPGDWSSNTNLRRCTHEEKGLWLDILCLMHDSQEYGVLRWELAEIALAIGSQRAKVQRLVDKGVLKGSDDHLLEGFIFVPRSGRKNGAPVVLIEQQAGPIWFSSRMVRDEYVRQNAGKSTRFGASTPEPDPSPSRRDGDYQGDGEGDGSSSSSSSSSFLRTFQGEAGVGEKCSRGEEERWGAVA